MEYDSTDHVAVDYPAIYSRSLSSPNKKTNKVIVITGMLRFFFFFFLNKKATLSKQNEQRKNEHRNESVITMHFYDKLLFKLFETRPHTSDLYEQFRSFTKRFVVD